MAKGQVLKGGFLTNELIFWKKKFILSMWKLTLGYGSKKRHHSSFFAFEANKGVKEPMLVRYKAFVI